MNQCLNDHCQSNLFLQYVQEEESLVKWPFASVIKLPDGTVCQELTVNEKQLNMQKDRKGLVNINDALFVV